MSLAIDPTQLARCVDKFPHVVWSTEPFVDMEPCSGAECMADRGWHDRAATEAVVSHLTPSGRRVSLRTCGGCLDGELAGLHSEDGLPKVPGLTARLLSFAAEKEVAS